MSGKIKKKKGARKAPKAAVKKPVSRAGKKKLSKKDLADFKKLVLKRKDEVTGNIKHISDENLRKSQKEASGDISGYSYHMADVASDTYDREFSLGLASNEVNLLYELDDALKKIEEGSFGICEDCKDLITRNRLKAVPYARFCLKCQQKKEKR